MRGGARYSQLACCLLHFAGRHHDNPNPSAVNKGYAGQVENNFFPSLTHEAFDGPFQLLALPAERDSSRDFQDNNVGVHVLGLNLQHKRGSFPGSFRAMNCDEGRLQG